MYENVGLTSLDYIEEILHLRKALADVSDECSKAYDKIANFEQQRWVSVKDRLPEPNTWVLVYSKQGSYMNLKVDYITRDGSWFNSLLVTHWMPLPQKPESEGDDN